jgi:cysteinyl-tRNA synthetase
MDEVLGLDLLKFEEIEIPSEIGELADKREEARKKKDFSRADELRDEIRKKGYEIFDTDKGWEIKEIGINKR